MRDREEQNAARHPIDDPTWSEQSVPRTEDRPPRIETRQNHEPGWTGAPRADQPRVGLSRLRLQTGATTKPDPTRHARNPRPGDNRETGAGSNRPSRVIAGTCQAEIGTSKTRVIGAVLPRG